MACRQSPVALLAPRYNHGSEGQPARGIFFSWTVKRAKSRKCFSPHRVELRSTTASHADNRWIYYTHVTSESDIWMLTLNEERE